MKTAISVPDALFQNIMQIAEEENTSRSKIFTEAVREYIQKRNNRKLLLAINETCSHEETAEEVKLRKRSRAYYSRRLRREKW